MNKETIQLGEPGRRILVVSVEDLLNLLTHYTDGDVPLDAEPLFVGFNKYLQRMVGIFTRSRQWRHARVDPVTGVAKPLHIRYEGKKIMSWHQRPEEPTTWKEGPDAPKRD